jgi:hypothetical protein
MVKIQQNILADFCLRAETSRAESLQNSVEARMGDRHVLRRAFSKMERRDESKNEASRTQVCFSAIFFLKNNMFKTRE